MWRWILLVGLTVLVKSQLSNRMNIDSCRHCTQTEGFFVDLNMSLVSIPMAVKFPEGFYCQYNMNYGIRWLLLVGFDTPVGCEKGEVTYYLSHNGNALDILSTIKYQVLQLSVDMEDTNCTRYVRSGYVLPNLGPMIQAKPVNYDIVPSGRQHWNTLEALLNYFRPSQKTIPEMTMEAAALANPILRPLLAVKSRVNASVSLVTSDVPPAAPTKIPSTSKPKITVTPKFVIPNMETESEE